MCTKNRRQVVTVSELELYTHIRTHKASVEELSKTSSGEESTIMDSRDYTIDENMTESKNVNVYFMENNYCYCLSQLAGSGYSYI